MPAVVSRDSSVVAYVTRWKVSRGGKRWVKAGVSRKAKRICAPLWGTRSCWSSSPKARSALSSGDPRGRREVRSPPSPRGRHLTRPYQTLFVQIFCSLTTSPVFGACQIFPFPA